MKTVNATTDNSQYPATFFIDHCGDIFDTAEDAEIVGVAGKVIVDEWHVGSDEAMKSAALDAFNNA